MILSQGTWGTMESDIGRKNRGRFGFEKNTFIHCGEEHGNEDVWGALDCLCREMAVSMTMKRNPRKRGQCRQKKN